MTGEETSEIRTWMADPKNIGALHRALLATPAVPLDVFDPFGVPPPFTGRLEMIGMAKSRMEDAYEAMLNALEGYPLFTMTQAKRADRMLRRLHQRRLGEPGAARHRQECLPAARRDATGIASDRRSVYARTKAERRRWRPAETAMIVAALDRTEERVVRVINSGLIDIITQLKEAGRKPPEEEDKD